MPKLSILICSVVTRQTFLDHLMGILAPQLTPDVELLVDQDNGETTIGAKRNRLLAKATGDYIAFVDDDDEVCPDYVRLILQAIEYNPDCIGFRMKRLVDGRFDSYGIHTMRYDKYGEHSKDGIRIYERTPNHLNPVRREFALQIGFESKNWGEDSDYAKRILPLLRTECFIDRIMYAYLYRGRHKRKGEIVNANPN